MYAKETVSYKRPTENPKPKLMANPSKLQPVNQKKITARIQPPKRYPLKNFHAQDKDQSPFPKEQK